MKLVDHLIERIIALKSPVVVGLDPVVESIPKFYYERYVDNSNSLEAVGNVIFDFNKDVIDAIHEYVPAVKPQIAYYEAYGIAGLIAFNKSVAYAKSKGLIVIDDAKRNDIGTVAQAYANGHIGMSRNLKGDLEKIFDVDFVTVNPYLGSDGVEPFIEICEELNKGIFILVKTSNESSGEFQDLFVDNRKKHVYEIVAEYVSRRADVLLGENGYSSIGAVVGSTYPQQALALRNAMKKSFFLVPGFGVQGGTAKDVLPCFNNDGLGALINSSRGVLYAYKNKYSSESVTQNEFKVEVTRAVIDMRDSIVHVLRANLSKMIY